MFTLFAILFAVVGLLFMGMGLLGEYVARIYTEVRRRPRYLIRTRIGGVAPPVELGARRPPVEQPAREERRGTGA